MKFECQIKEPSFDIKGNVIANFAVKRAFLEAYEEFKGCDKLILEIKPYKAKRSLNANAYFHVLVDKLANKMGESKPAMKNKMLRNYGQLDFENDKLITFIIDDEIDVNEYEHIHLRPTSKTKVLDNGRLYRVYLVVRGSHTYNTYEMAKLIDGTIYECKSAGMSDSEIASPEEQRILKERYGVNIG